MSKENKVMIVSMGVNVVLALTKVLCGFIWASQALIADGIHSFSDLTTDLFAIIGNALSRKPADEKHPFGHGKLEYVTSIGISLAVIFIGFSVIYNSFNHVVVIPNALVIVVSLFTIVAKLLLSRYVTKKGYEYKQSVLIASGKESKADVISSVVVLISSILIQFSNYISVFKYTELIATIIVGMFIVRIGLGILKENISTIIGEQETDDDLIKAVQDIILEEKDIIKIDKLNLIKYGCYFEIVAEVGMDEKLTLIESHDVIERIEKKLEEFDERNRYITIHVNPYRMKETSK